MAQEKGAFYVRKQNGQTVESSLEAEGLRKFGLLRKLIRNGSLANGSILLWDTPETNLSPALYPAVADILLGIQ